MFMMLNIENLEDYLKFEGKSQIFSWYKPPIIWKKELIEKEKRKEEPYFREKNSTN